jgi:hypothetical protein
MHMRGFSTRARVIIRASMRRLANYFRTCFSILCLLLSLTVAVFWLRTRWGQDTALLTYARWLPDGSAASDFLELRSGLGPAVTLSLGHGRVGPPNGQPIWGYYVNADNSHGRPRLDLHHEPYDPLELQLFNSTGLTSGFVGAPGWGPVHWLTADRFNTYPGESALGFEIAISHWFLAALLAIPPAWTTRRILRQRRQQRLRTRANLCPKCGYDLRTQLAQPTPTPCPECGTVPKQRT